MKKKSPDHSLEAKFLALLDPLSQDNPCGQDLEYHPDLLVLGARLSPQEQAQYGDFKAPSEQVNWREVQDALMTMLTRGKDLRALILLLRCRIQQAGAQGAFEGFYLLAQVLKRFGAELHPQHCIEGVSDPSVRANVLAELSNAQTVLADLRALLIEAALASRLSVRDVERALALPHPSDAMPAQSVRLQLFTLWQQEHAGLRALVKVKALVTEIYEWVKQDLGDEAPDLTPLCVVLAAFDEKSLSQSDVATACDAPQPLSVSAPMSAAPHSASAEVSSVDALVHDERASLMPEVAASTPIRSRQHAKHVLQTLRQWFEHSEPSSPVADLLHQAEILIGRPYHEVADAIPLELLGRWRQKR